MQAPVQRSSNIELLRILAMLAIIMHHYVVHSGMENLYDYAAQPPIMHMYQICGMLGKTMVNVFPLITGYFMCTKHLTVTRFLKVYLEVKFYRILLYILLAAAGVEALSAGRIFGTVFSVLQNAGNDFASSFLVFYLFIPFYNRLIRHISREEHRLLVGGILLFYTLGSSLFFNYSIFSEIPWYIVLYLVAAYLRLYPAQWQENTALLGGTTVLFLILDAASILVCDKASQGSLLFPYYFLYNANKILAFLTAVSLFTFFCAVRLPYSRLINAVAKTAFGVFLIHDNSLAMRQFLWMDLLQVTKWYNASVGAALLALLGTAVGIFVVCSLLDMVRIWLLEKPVFSYISRQEGAMERTLHKMTGLDGAKR